MRVVYLCFYSDWSQCQCDMASIVNVDKIADGAVTISVQCLEQHLSLWSIVRMHKEGLGFGLFIWVAIPTCSLVSLYH